MRIAILHHHLRTGGVTRVIELAGAGLVARGHEVLVVVGEPAPGAALVSALRYGAPAGEAAELAAGVEAACRARWSHPADVLLVHNHALGKNLSLPLAVARWAREGRPLVLQLHDFAENGRPANYRRLREGLGSPRLLAQVLYPCGGNVVLAVLNRRAADAIRSAGGAAALLPNPILPPRTGSPLRRDVLESDRLVVYPTRGIRRKNLGEFLLHAATAPKGATFAISGAPPGPNAHYQWWRRAAALLELPVRFDACRTWGCEPGDLLAAAHAACTTSIEEGFGMAFLEPWTLGCQVFGRDLPGVTADFHQAGIPTGNLYKRWDVPAHMLDRRAIEAAVLRDVQRALAAYGRPCDPSATQKAIDAVVSPDGYDFGRLNESFQLAVLRNPGNLAPPPAASLDPKAVRTAITAAFAHHSVENLLSQAASASGQPTFLDPLRILDAMLDFSDFSALRFR